ncbi:MAG: hypothetical protein BWY74_01943 [Firmicutes bacterium ADurb.Bin419]|nr:MAG: hypothetical protein BWY74_01943 [Firmicutes bacterium ADurb.Bin419]
MKEKKDIMEMTLKEILYIPEKERLQKAVDLFNSNYKQLTEAVNKGEGVISKKVQGIVDQIEVLKSKKSDVAKKIRDYIEADKACDDLFVAIKRIDDEIRPLIDTVSILKKEGKYPDSEKIISIAQKAFSAAVEMDEADQEFHKALGKYNERLNQVRELVRINHSKSFALGNIRGLTLRNCISKAYGHTIPEKAAYCNMDELERMAREAIAQRRKRA